MPFEANTQTRNFQLSSHIAMGPIRKVGPPDSQRYDLMTFEHFKVMHQNVWAVTQAANPLMANVNKSNIFKNALWAEIWAECPYVIVDVMRKRLADAAKDNNVQGRSRVRDDPERLYFIDTSHVEEPFRVYHSTRHDLFAQVLGRRPAFLRKTLRGTRLKNDVKAVLEQPEVLKQDALLKCLAKAVFKARPYDGRRVPRVLRGCEAQGDERGFVLVWVSGKEQPYWLETLLMILHPVH
uniref:Uncharacterized protein n=1 Tax=Chromera velia CCMP2878 TaxID=1169474 RepID=A0A0K6S963_9ALVE|eukprot:Cvel_6550.t1-p1 / transcript=Cvel_6550.t1 / gene=Cvel_6550 / organism=Chromera_velia_CCMP2878 / gene_product=hypothetical protein / transcript_product=hypothetical protein / location=Cvel_scaffold322:68765-72296(-) / protein_length=237 / sequence_SO=supercontig / SO=protein_coding / is_pseudo=false